MPYLTSSTPACLPVYTKFLHYLCVMCTILFQHSEVYLFIQQIFTTFKPSVMQCEVAKMPQTHHVFKKCIVFRRKAYTYLVVLVSTTGSSNKYHKRGTDRIVQELRGKRIYFKLRLLGLGCRLNGALMGR